MSACIPALLRLLRLLRHFEVPSAGILNFSQVFRQHVRHQRLALITFKSRRVPFFEGLIPARRGEIQAQVRTFSAELFIEEGPLAPGTPVVHQIIKTVAPPR
jgi:hypothetical protein